MKMQKNVLGEDLMPCCLDPVTGYFRDGFCRTDESDHGSHVVCVLVTQDFLSFSKKAGNDLSTPNALFRFPGLKPGDKWCVCATRFKEAAEAGFGPPVVLESTSFRALEFVTLEMLRKHALENANG
jgi:uncharacterized protein